MMDYEIRKVAWTTFDEVAFIRALSQTPSPALRAQLLEGYLRGFNRRVRWGAIDRAVAKETLIATLKDL